MGDIIKRLFRKLNAWSEDFSDHMSEWFSHPLFLVGNIIFWVFWIATEREPFPYGQLTLIVSLEAIFMSILILNSSTRKGNADTELMLKDIRMSQGMWDTVDEMHEDIDDIHEDIEDIKNALDLSDTHE